MPVESYPWTIREVAPEEVKPSATIYVPTPTKWYDVLIKPPYIYIILIGIGLYLLFQYRVMKR